MVCIKINMETFCILKIVPTFIFRKVAHSLFELLGSNQPVNVIVQILFFKFHRIIKGNVRDLIGMFKK